MTVKYTIEVPNECSAELWKLLTENFNVIFTRGNTLFTVKYYTLN